MLQKVLTNPKCCVIVVLRNATRGGEQMAKYPELKKLKGKMVEQGETYRSMSAKTGIPLNTLNNKLNGYSLFDIVEALLVCEILEIDVKDIPIFFALNVA